MKLFTCSMVVILTAGTHFVVNAKHTKKCKAVLGEAKRGLLRHWATTKKAANTDSLFNYPDTKDLYRKFVLKSPEQIKLKRASRKLWAK